MPLVTTTEMFKKAYEGGYAIGAFNVNNMEIVQGITRAAKKLNAPVILQCSAGARKYASHEYLVAMVKAAAEETGLPIALHLDHGPDFETCKECIDGGLGTLAGVEDDVKVDADNASYTRPEEVYDFVTRTGVDSLAIAIGTSHGAYKFKPGQKPQLRFDILEEVGKKLPGFPIVLHGASSVNQDHIKLINKFGGEMPDAIGIPEDMLRKAASMAVCKINVDSDIRIAMTAAIREHFAENPTHFDPRQYLTPARNLIEEVVAHKIDVVFGSTGHAND